ncbi:hypothetical protein N0V82_004531 [Gnomoniopsis sp. IMI 355080]|nr:hypothetical protein N0V82_004531 [Gnomoniopsis sp. IMI 355080]
MKIIIVGAGLGGLTAAFRLAKSGHDVEVLERSSTLVPKGGAINVRAGGSRAMVSWGLAPDFEAIASETPHTLLRSRATGDVMMRNIVTDASDVPDWGLMRQDVMKVLHKKCQEVGAKFHFGQVVAAVDDDAERAVVKMADGTTMEADLVLAADGVRSRIRSQILSDLNGAHDPIISDFNFYGVIVDEAELVGRPGTKRLMEGNNINIWMGSGGYTVTRFHSKFRQVDALFGVISEVDGKALWDEKGDIEFVRNFYKDDCSELVQILAAAKSCDRWKLAELPDLPRWTSKAGRVLLLGDSAHAMHPSAALGYTTIIEDVAVLDSLISWQGLTDKDLVKQIPQIATDWQAICKPRAERIKAYSRANTDMFCGHPPTPLDNLERRNIKSLKGIEADMNAKFTTGRFTKWSLDYNAIAAAKKYIREARARI